MNEEFIDFPPSDEISKRPFPKFGKNQTTDEIFEQNSRPCSSDPYDLTVRIKRGYKMFIKKGTNRMTLMRFLLAKLVYSSEGLSIEEFLCLFHIYFDLTEMKDPLFLSKYQFFLERVGTLLDEISGIQTFPVQALTDAEVDNDFFLGYFPSKREYYGLCGQRDLRRSFRFVLNDTLVPQKRLPVRYIGVGYKDKGTCRNLAEDGSPGWKEVGTFFSNQEREAEELGSSFSEIPEF